MQHEDILDQVNWASVATCTGDAVAVPGLLRKLRDGDDDAKFKAFDELGWLLLAEGTVYEAAAYAAPYLVELAKAQGNFGRFLAFSLLSAFACGDEEAWLASRPSSAHLRALVARLEAMTDDDYQAWQRERVAEARNERERRQRERQAQYATLAGHREALQCRLAAFDAVRAGIPTYLAALDDADQHARKWAVKLLSWFGDEEPAHTIAVRAIQRVLDAESNEEVLSAACMSAGIAGRPGDAELVARLRELRAYPSPPVWAAAAMALVWIDPHVDRGVVQAVYDCLFEGPDETDWFPFLEGDMTAMAAATVARLAPETAHDRVAVLVVRWATADPENDDVLARAILDAAFPDGPIPDGTRFTDLDPAAASAVRAFASRDRADKVGTWVLLGEYNLPTSRQALNNWINTH